MEDFIANTLMPILQVLMTTLITLAVGVAANYLQKKTGIEVSKEKIDFVTKAAIDAVLKAEGRAERYLTDKGISIVGKSKHADAVNSLLAMAPDLTQEDAKHYVDMAVAKIPGIGKVGVQ